MASTTFVPNPNPCGGINNQYDGCMEYFPRMPTSQQLCGRCKKLNTPNLSEIDRERFEQYITCKSCGVCGRSIASPCGTCRRNDLELAGEIDSSRNSAAEERHARAQKSFGNRPAIPPVPLFSVEPVGHPSIGATTALAEVETSRSSSQKGMWSVAYKVRRGNKGTLDSGLGRGSSTFQGDTTMPKVLENLVKQISVNWTRLEGNSLDLLPSECELRFTNNFVFAEESQTLTIKDFYSFYLNRPDGLALLYPSTNTSTKSQGQARGTTLYLEVYLNESLYRARLAPFEESSGKKRSSGNLLQSALSSVAKRRRSGTITGVLTSTFQSHGGSELSLEKSIIPTTLVSFNRMSCEVDAVTGKSRIEEAYNKETGKLDKKELDLNANDRGRSKNVYLLTIGDRKYVAKRFMDSIAIGKSGADMNLNYLLHELVRVKRLAGFKELFTTYAATQGVEVAGLSTV